MTLRPITASKKRDRVREIEMKREREGIKPQPREKEIEKKFQDWIPLCNF